MKTMVKQPNPNPPYIQYRIYSFQLIRSYLIPDRSHRYWDRDWKL